MSRGVILLAHNNSEIDYGQMALINALLIKKNMGVPVTLITDNGTMGWLSQNYSSDLINSTFDTIIEIELNNPRPNIRSYKDSSFTIKKLQYNNFTRTSVYELSPYDETLVIDTDFLILDDTLNNVWGSEKDFMMNKHVKSPIPAKFNNVRLHDFGIPQYWATVFYFKKTETAQLVFDLCSHIKEQYDFYKFIYNFQNNLFRNDFVFSIALHILSGFEESNDFDLPINSLLFTSDEDVLIDVIDVNKLLVLIEKENEPGNYFPMKVTRNVHIMNKYAINRLVDKFIKFYKVAE